MYQSQLNTLNMMKSFILFMDKNRVVWESKTPVMTKFNRLRGIAEQLKTAGTNQQDTNTRGFTKEKSANKEELAGLAYLFCQRIRSYAKDQELISLYESLDFTKAKLIIERDEDLINICKTISQKVTELLTVAADYNLTESELEVFQNAIEDFDTSIAKRDEIGDNRTLATSEIEKLIKDSQELLKDLDSLIVGVITDQVFIAGYQQARKVTDLKARGKNNAAGLSEAQ